MPNRKNVDSVIAEADRLLQVWAENVKFAMGDVTLDGLKVEVDKLRNLRHSRDEVRVKLSKLINDTKDQMKVIDSYNTRGRGGMKATFGPDSAQYAQMGGTRQSDRRPAPKKKSKAPSA